MTFVLPPGSPLGNHGNARAISLHTMNGREPTPAQLAEVERIFLDHMATGRLSLAGYRVHDADMTDGSLVSIVSNSGQHDVLLWPAGGQAPIRYQLHPAFWLNMGGAGATHPTPVNSATWRGMPYDSAEPPTLKQDHRIKHPGNRTWFDCRADSPAKGLVLSWWGLSKDLYGNMINFPDAQAEPSPDGYRLLYCNGVKIGEIRNLGPGTGSAIYGACIADVGGTLKVCVLACSYLKVDVSGPEGTLLHYNSYADSPGVTTNQGISRLTLNLYQADLPATFRQFLFRELDFSGPALAQVSVGVDNTVSLPGQTFFKIAGVDYRFTNPSSWRLTTGCKFNASGTAGILPVRGYVDVSAGAGTADGVGYILIDPRDGTLSTVLNPRDGSQTNTPPAAVTAHYDDLYPSRHTTITGQWAHYDWNEDTLILAITGTASIYTDATKTVLAATNYWGYTSQDGMLYDLAGSDLGTGPTITGDLRGRLVDFINRSAGLRRLYYRGTLVTAGAASAGSNLSSKWEGADTSFDRRLTVYRSDDVVRAWADNTEISATLNGITDFQFQQVRQPILCGPLARLDGQLRPPKQYVAGEPPP